MPSLSTVGFSSAPNPQRRLQPDTRPPHFSSASQSEHSTQPGHTRLQRPQAAPQSCTRKVLGYIGTGIRHLIQGTLYLVPTSIKQPIAQKAQATLNTLLAGFRLDPNAPETKVFAHHELGHAVTALAAGLPMNGLYLANIRRSGGGVLYSREIENWPNTPQNFYKLLITLMAGHAAELNQATPEQAQDLHFISQSRMRALSDIAKAIPLVRGAQEHGWFRLEAGDQIPADIDLDRYVALIQKAGRNAAEQAQQREYALRVRDFMRLSIVQQALHTAQQIHAAVPAEKRAQMADTVTHCNLGLTQSELYDLLEQHLNQETLDRMQSPFKRFMQAQAPARKTD